jgi:hypothetical protein
MRWSGLLPNSPSAAARWFTHRQRVYAIDFDHSHFAAVWGAHDRATGNIYLYDAYLAPRTDLAIHADEVRQRGRWIPGLFEPWARGRSEAFGLRSIDRLVGVGLDLFDVTGDPEEGVAVVAEMLTSGRLRVFRTMDLWLTAYRQYQRTDDGDLVDRDDHLMRATAPLVLYGPDIAISENKASIEVDYGAVRSSPSARAGCRPAAYGIALEARD